MVRVNDGVLVATSVPGTSIRLGKAPVATLLLLGRAGSCEERDTVSGLLQRLVRCSESRWGGLVAWTLAGSPFALFALLLLAGRTSSLSELAARVGTPALQVVSTLSLVLLAVVMWHDHRIRERRGWWMAALVFTTYIAAVLYLVLHRRTLVRR